MQHQESARGVSFARAYGQGPLREVLGDTLRPGGVALTDRAVRLAKFAPGALVADAGCGLGTTVARLDAIHGLRAIGFDLSLGLLLQGDPAAPLAGADIARLPLADATLDGVVCECVLSLFADRAPVLAEFWRVLKRGAKVVVTDSYLRGPLSAEAREGLEQESCLRHAAGALELAEELSAAGFRPAVMEDHSEGLRRLGAQLALRGVSFCAAPGQAGYCLMVGEKR